MAFHLFRQTSSQVEELRTQAQTKKNDTNVTTGMSKRRAEETPALSTAWSQTSGLQNGEKCLLSHTSVALC